jgi:miniconductance mechanosensitive channel
MAESDGRRIKRAINIDMNTIRLCTKDEIEKLKEIHLITGYLEKKQADLAKYNEEHGIKENESVVNGRRITNIGTFRAYIIEYLRHHPMINQNLTLLVRQLNPTPQGIPIEVYVFSKDKNWINYEGIQADIFDHLLAVIPEFGLRVFQQPSGHDLGRLVPGSA